MELLNPRFYRRFCFELITKLPLPLFESLADGKLTPDEAKYIADIILDILVENLSEAEDIVSREKG